MGDYGIYLDGWGDYQDAMEEERWWNGYEAHQEKMHAELAAAELAEKRALKKKAKKAKKAEKAATAVVSAKPVFKAAAGSVVTRQGTVKSPDGWETVVARGTVVVTKRK